MQAPSLRVTAHNPAITREALKAALVADAHLEHAEAGALADSILAHAPPNFVGGAPAGGALIEQIAGALRKLGFRVVVAA